MHAEVHVVIVATRKRRRVLVITCFVRHRRGCTEADAAVQSEAKVRPLVDGFFETGAFPDASSRAHCSPLYNPPSGCDNALVTEPTGGPRLRRG
jgi:hypothetical protein